MGPNTHLAVVRYTNTRDGSTRRRRAGSRRRLFAFAAEMAGGLAGGEASERQCGELLGDLLHAQAALWVVPFVEPVQHSEQPVRRHLNVEIRAELAVVDAFAQDLLPAALVVLRRKTDHFAEAALHRLALAKIDKKLRIMAVERLQMGGDRQLQLVGRSPVGGGDLRYFAVHLRDRFFDDEVEQLLFAVEVMVQASLEEPDLIGDVTDGGGVIALRAEHLGGRRNDVV